MELMSETVQLFITCIIDTLYPDIGKAVVQVLRRVGKSIEFPSAQTCCGQPAFNAGLWDQARPIAIHTIKTFEKTRGDIVIPSGSCASMIRYHYPELFDNDPIWEGRAKSFAERVFELSEYLVDRLGVEDVGACFPHKLTYHSSCHLLRELGVEHQPRTLLAHVRGAEFIELPSATDCCGFGGVFSVEHPEISAAMLDRKIANIEACGAPFVVTCDAGCMTNMNGRLARLKKPQRALHLAEVLASI